MPWHCPACNFIIRHNDIETAPRMGVRYRCHVCRLELLVDQRTNRLSVVPTDDEEAAPNKRTRPTK